MMMCFIVYIVLIRIVLNLLIDQIERAALCILAIGSKVVNVPLLMDHERNVIKRQNENNTFQSHQMLVYIYLSIRLFSSLVDEFFCCCTVFIYTLKILV